MNDIAKNINSLSSSEFGSYLWHPHSTSMKPLLSNNLRPLCSQTAW